MWLFFDTPDHPLIAHIRTLIDAYGVDRFWKINGTQYVFSGNVTVCGTESRWQLMESLPTQVSDNVIINISNSKDQDTYVWWERLFKRAIFLRDQSIKREEEERIQSRINSDIEKYLSKESPLLEAKEDLKQMEFHKKEIIRIATKWQDKFTSLHL